MPPFYLWERYIYTHIHTYTYICKIYAYILQSFTYSSYGALSSMDIPEDCFLLSPVTYYRMPPPPKDWIANSCQGRIWLLKMRRIAVEEDRLRKALVTILLANPLKFWNIKMLRNTFLANNYIHKNRRTYFYITIISETNLFHLFNPSELIWNIY